MWQLRLTLPKTLLYCKCGNGALMLMVSFAFFPLMHYSLNYLKCELSPSPQPELYAGVELCIVLLLRLFFFFLQYFLFVFKVSCTKWRIWQSLRAFWSLVLQRLALVAPPVSALPPSALHPPHLLIIQLLTWAHPASNTAWTTRWTSALKGEFEAICGFGLAI